MSLLVGKYEVDLWGVVQGCDQTAPKSDPGSSTLEAVIGFPGHVETLDTAQVNQRPQQGLSVPEPLSESLSEGLPLWRTR